MVEWMLALLNCAVGLTGTTTTARPLHERTPIVTSLRQCRTMAEWTQVVPPTETRPPPLVGVADAPPAYECQLAPQFCVGAEDQAWWRRQRRSPPLVVVARVRRQQTPAHIEQ